jgi:predicted DCC family thiol-disulfide oxidoreductase YuxK
MKKTYPLTIFYDGGCAVCAAEMAHYSRHNPSQRLRFVDISGPGFSAGKYGRSDREFMRRLHVQTANGAFATGVDAFLLIWNAYPRGTFYPLLGKIIGLPGVLSMARAGYSLLARFRHLLPGRKDCGSGICLRPSDDPKRIDKDD